MSPKSSLHLFIATLCSAVGMAIANLAPAQTPPTPPNPDKVLNGLAAVVNGNPITHSEVRKSVSAQSFLLRKRFPAGGAEFEKELGKTRARALQDLIDRELIISNYDRLLLEGKIGPIKDFFIDDALQRDIRERADGDRETFLKQLKSAGITIKLYRELLLKRMIVTAMRSDSTKSIRTPTPDERDAYFNKNKDGFRAKSFVKLRTITVLKFTGDETITPADQKRLAEEIQLRISKGADFASEAKLYSIDSAADSGGDRGWIDEESPTLNATLAEVAFSLKRDQISKVIDDGRAYYILWAEDTKPGALPDRAEIEDKINQLVLQEKRKKAVDEWLVNMRKGASIRLF
ncbi:MAG: peptidyl-prolyl cis-trans isomerase [Verrucomicrobiales bacterium]|nr:peptidyl-prolyl cis-trans isomerase [Verrucomicrobiales bacterium]